MEDSFENFFFIFFRVSRMALERDVYLTVSQWLKKYAAFKKMTVKMEREQMARYFMHVSYTRVEIKAGTASFEPLF